MLIARESVASGCRRIRSSLSDRKRRGSYNSGGILRSELDNDTRRLQLAQRVCRYRIALTPSVRVVPNHGDLEQRNRDGDRTGRAGTSRDDRLNERNAAGARHSAVIRKVAGQIVQNASVWDLRQKWIKKFLPPGVPLDPALIKAEAPLP